MRDFTDEALRIVELLEQILLQLDMHTLLVSAQRVSKSWHIVIISSQELQRALFFQAASESDKAVSYDQKPNPLLKELFPAWFGKSPEHSPESVSKEHTHNKIYGKDGFRDLALRRASVAHGRGQNPFLRNAASWKRMLVAQPPINRLGAIWHTSALGGSSLGTELKIKEDGLRMEEFYNIVLQHSAWPRVSTSFLAIWDFDIIPGEQTLPREFSMVEKQDHRTVRENMAARDCDMVLVLNGTRSCVVNMIKTEYIDFWTACGAQFDLKNKWGPSQTSEKTLYTSYP
jgi:hypothetical protein